MEKAKVSGLHAAANPWTNPALEAAEYLPPSDAAGDTAVTHRLGAGSVRAG